MLKEKHDYPPAMTKQHWLPNDSGVEGGLLRSTRCPTTSPASSCPEHPSLQHTKLLTSSPALLTHLLVAFEQGLSCLDFLFNLEDSYLPFKSSSKVTFSGKEFSLSPSSVLPEQVSNVSIFITCQSFLWLLVYVFTLYAFQDEGFCPLTSVLSGVDVVGVQERAVGGCVYNSPAVAG